MWERLRRRATFANTVSVVALFVALGGTGYAAVQVTGDDVRNGSLTGADIRDGSLRAADLAPGVAAAGIKTADQRGARGLRGPKGLRGFRGRPGPAGPTGATGAAGAAGPPGTAAGYAHVHGDGTVDLAHSKNITGGNVVVQNSTYCFRGLGFPFGSITATSDLADGGTNATASAAIGAPGDCGSVAGTQAAVALSGGGHAFYVVFN